VKEQDENVGALGIAATRKSVLVQKREQFTIYTNYGKDPNKLNAAECQ
jgi:hypothetical protein